MSDDLVNQLTLNFLISKSQLHKLNKKKTENVNKNKDIKKYSKRINDLFNDLLVCKVPDDLLYDVRATFDDFIDKSIHYFRLHDHNLLLNTERMDNDCIKDDIDY